MKQHKWHKEIKAWADGAEIEHRWNGNIYIWHKCTKPIDWDNELIEYRIKTQPKEPTYLYVYEDIGGINITSDKNYATKDMEYIGRIKLEDVDD